MDYETIEKLNNEDISQLFNNIIELPNLLSGACVRHTYYCDTYSVETTSYFWTAYSCYNSETETRYTQSSTDSCPSGYYFQVAQCNTYYFRYWGGPC